MNEWNGTVKSFNWEEVHTLKKGNDITVLSIFAIVMFSVWLKNIVAAC